MRGSLQMNDLIYIMMKRIKLLIIIPILFALVGLIVSLYILTPIYQAQADLLVNQTTTTDGDPRGFTDVDMNLRLIETYHFIINSSRITENIISELDNKYSVKELEKKLSIETSSETQIISLFIEDSDPEVASEIVNLYVEVSKKEISELMEMDNIRILTKSKEENLLTPIYPKPVFITIISLLVGGMLILIYILISAYFNAKINSRSDVERYLNIPVLGAISMFSQKDSEISKQRFEELDFANLVLQMNKNESVMESFRTLRTNIQFQKSVKQLTSILVTSTEKDEGKSISSRNLAISMAMDNKKTILIDADLRESSFLGRENTNKNIGLTNYLSGTSEIKDILIETSIPNLYMVNTGPLPPNPTELIASEKMDELLSELEARFDMIIIDSPPLLFTDPAVLAAKVDGSLFVCNAGETKVMHAQQAIQQLEAVQATILGAVLNNKKEKKKATSY